MPDTPATPAPGVYTPEQGVRIAPHLPGPDGLHDAQRDALARLRVPFPPAQIGKLPKGGAMLDYVGHADLTARLLDVDPAWTWEPVAFGPDGLPAYDAKGGLWIRLTVAGVTRLGYGDGPDPKQRIGDALRNAAMRFGAALDLWAKGDRDYGGAHDAQQARRPDPMPAHVQAVYDRIGRLDEADRARLRTWVDEQGITVSRDMSDADAEAVIARADALAAR